MALPTNYIDTSGLTYCGEEAKKIFAKDIYSLDLRNVGVTFMDNVKGRRKIYMGEWDNAWQSYQCAFSPDGQVKLSEAFVEVVPIKVNKEFCRNEFWDSFLVDETEISLRGGIPQTFYEWYFTHLREQMAKEYQDIAFNGDTGYTGTTKAYRNIADGWVKQLGDSDATEVTGATTFTVNNILAQVEAVIKAGLDVAAANETSTDGYKVLMNKADVDLLKMALGTMCCPNNESIFSNYAKGPDGGVYIFGFPVVPTEVDRNVVIFGPVKNLVLAFDTYNITVEYKIIDMKDTTLDDSYRVGAISNIGMGIIYPELFAFSKA